MGEEERGESGGAVREDSKGPKGTEMRALPPEPHVTLFIALLPSGPGSFLSNIKTPIKDDNTFSLSFFLLELSQAVCFSIYYLPRHFISYLICNMTN